MTQTLTYQQMGTSAPESPPACEGGLYKPIREYDAKTLAWDLTGHLAYGTGTGVTFWLLAKASD